MAPNIGPKTFPRGNTDLLAPSSKQSTSVPSLDQASPTDLNHPPATFRPGNLNLPLPFPVLPAKMQPYFGPSFEPSFEPYFDFDSQPLWAGNGVPNLDSFLPMPHLAGQITIPPAGNSLGLSPAGATVNPFAVDPFTQVPAAPFDAFGSNQFNVSSSSATTATSDF